MEATAGLQTSQPRPVPKRARMSSKERSCSTRTASKSSARDSAKCSHSALETVIPDLVSSDSSSFFSTGTQDPHWVPARVQPFSSLRSWTGS